MAPQPQPMSDVQKARRQALIETRRGTHPRRVLEGLRARGLEEQEAERLVAAATEEVATARIAAGRKHALLGALLLLAGLVLTVGSIAGAMQGGRVVVLYYGAIVVGLSQAVAGLAQARRWQARLDGALHASRPTAIRRPRRPLR